MSGGTLCCVIVMVVDVSTSIDMCSILIDFYENPIYKKKKNVGSNVNEIGFEISLPLRHQNIADFVSSLPRIYA